MNERTNEWMNERTNKWMNEWMNVHMYFDWTKEQLYVAYVSKTTPPKGAKNNETS